MTSIELNEQEVQEKRESIALHFGIGKTGIKHVKQDPKDYDDEFLLNFDALAPNTPTPKPEYHLKYYYLVEVVDKSTAEANGAYFLERGDKTNTCTGTTMYTRLLDSDYYFRWM